MRRSVAGSLVLALVAVAPLAAQQGMDTVTIQTTPVADGVYMLMGRGGNIGLSVGPDGAFVIDDQYATLTAKIVTAIHAVTPKPVRFVINTHWHGDHTGGNENLGEAGAIIVAHENVRRRLSTEQFTAFFNRRSEPAPPAALPIVTFTDAVTFYWNGEEIHVIHVHPAHTDGDAIVVFTHANVIHAGDTYFSGRYPFIDVSSGGDIHGMVAAADRMLGLADSTTKIIPGHGPLSNAAELATYRDMLITVRDRVARLIADGATREAAIAAKPTADLDAVWGEASISGDQFVGMVYDSMTR